MHDATQVPLNQEYAGLRLRHCKSENGTEWDGFEDLELARTIDLKIWNKPSNPAGYSQILAEFLRRYHLKGSEVAANWYKLFSPTDKELWPNDRYEGRKPPKKLEEAFRAVEDHQRFFLAPKSPQHRHQADRYVYTTQPYDLTLEEYKALEAALKPYGMFMDVSYKDGWHYPGRCPLIVVAHFPIQLTK